ncbi:MAG: Cof-type family hydrolase [Proteobacteria bacterium]|nr:Cof-type family hydrolase [Pseudomonadota bacterium]
MAYRLIALDLDGTLLDSHAQIRPETIRALQQARQQGIEIIVVTGRHHIAAYPYHHQLQLSTPAICCNGTYAYDYHARSAVAANPLSKTQMLRILEKIRAHHIQGLVYVDDAMCYEVADANIARMRAWADSLPAHVRPTIKQVASFEQLAGEAKSIWKFLAIKQDETASLDAFLAEIEAEPDLSYEWSGATRIDITQSENSKGARLAEWIATRGIDPSEVIAFGDHRNDMSMLRMAGLGVAMGNSDEVVQSCAQWVAGTHDTDAIAETLRRFVLSQ